MDKINVSPFPELGWEFNSWRGKDVLPCWAGFQSRLADYGAQSSDEISNGKVVVHVATDARQQNSPTLEQTAAYDFLLKNEVAIQKQVLAAIFTDYPETQKMYGYTDEEKEEFMPDVSQIEDFRSLIGVSTIHVLTVAKDGMACLGFEFDCSWDEEHGLGVVTHQGRVLKVGAADVSFVDWMVAEAL